MVNLPVGKFKSYFCVLIASETFREIYYSSRRNMRFNVSLTVIYHAHGDFVSLRIIQKVFKSTETRRVFKRGISQVRKFFCSFIFLELGLGLHITAHAQNVSMNTKTKRVFQRSISHCLKCFCNFMDMYFRDSIDDSCSCNFDKNYFPGQTQWRRY